MPADHDGRIGVALIRCDGFCSLDATSRGTVLSRPFTWRGTGLLLNAAAAAPPPGAHVPAGSGAAFFDGSPGGRGSIRVEVRDERGKPLPGLTLARCEPLVGDAPETPAGWAGRRDLSCLEGRTVQLFFEIRNACLYAWKTTAPGRKRAAP